jgi:tetratricopeptide (TPR) repeat protein
MHPIATVLRNGSQHLTNKMKIPLTLRPPFFAVVMVALAAGVALCGCGRHSGTPTKPSAIRPSGADPLAIALAPHSGNGRLDGEIRHIQEQVRGASDPEISIEQLGWLFVAKARESFDPGFYKLAEQCALSLESRRSGSPEAMLLRGHALHSQHYFREAESLAQQLVTKRGLAFDYGLLGDILVDVGRVDEAAQAYQAMLDLRPDPQGYARAAHIRWLKGDLDGAVEIMRMAVGGASPSDPESAAWILSQLARYLWQAGKVVEADRALQSALSVQTNYPPALLLRGRMELTEAKSDDAIQLLREAAQLNPLPEYQWALSEALRAAHCEHEARAVEAEIISRGPSSDPRTCSLFLATQRERVELAERLARQELNERADVLTHDALAWALAATGNFSEARTHMNLALSQGTQDARLYFHAAVIAARAEKFDEAKDFLAKAFASQSQLLPSELAQLRSAEAMLPSSPLSLVAPTSIALP